MAFAVLVYVVAATAVLAAERPLARLAHRDGTTAWIYEHIQAPALRAAAVVIFVLAAYPQLYGIDSAPALGTLLEAGHGRLDSLLTAALVVTLLLPLLPVVTAVPGVLLAVQGITACAVVFSWLAPAAGVAAPGYWIGWPATAGLLAVLLAGEGLIRLLAREGAAHSARPGPLAETLRLAMQLPAVMVYGQALGSQLPA